MRSLTASLAALSITCGFAVSAAASDPLDTASRLEPVGAAKLDEVRGGFIGLSFPPNISLSDLISPEGAAQGLRQQQGRLILDADLNTVFGKAVGFGDGIRGRIPSGRSFNETDFEFVRRVAERLRHRDR